MKKNFNINLFGTLYNIDEDAYNLLDSYLKSMQRYFSRKEGGEEIADDIEHRVAELLWQQSEAGMTAVDINVVKGIIDTIGRAENIAGDEACTTGHEDNFKERFTQFAEDAGRYACDSYDKGKRHIKTHRLYRCVDDKVLGGVCSGLAVYFGAGEPVIWRLGAVLLTILGIGFPLPVVYIVLWLVIPEALTPEDRLRQRGMEITPDNLVLQVKNDSQPVVVQKKGNGCLKTILVILLFGLLLPLIFVFLFWMKAMSTLMMLVSSY